jgi:hypothetical protein
LGLDWWCDSGSSCGYVLLSGCSQFQIVRADAAVELCGGALIKLCCEPALKAELCVVGPGGLRRPAQVEGGPRGLGCHQVKIGTSDLPLRERPRGVSVGYGTPATIVVKMIVRFVVR